MSYPILTCVLTTLAVAAWAQGSLSPSLGIIPANASLVVGTVLTTTVWTPSELIDARVPLRPDRTWYSIRLRIDSITPAQPDLPSMAEPGVIEAFLRDPPASDLPGARVEARLEIVGDTRATRWWVSNISVLLPQR